MRRASFTTPTEDCQILKLETSDNVILHANTNDHQVLFGLNSSKGSNLEAIIWAKFNVDTFDGIQLVAGLKYDNARYAQAASAQVSLYATSTTNWDETTIFTGPMTWDGSKFVLNLVQSQLNPVSLEGDITVRVYIEILRRDKLYTAETYLNHLGIYDSFFRLKQEVDFLDITKLDE
jgi:hypothetical protein